MTDGRRHAAAAAWFVAVAIFATWPVVLHPLTRVPDNLADPLEIAWIFAWGAHGIVHHPLHLFNGNMFFPNRYTLAFTESMLGLALPLAPVFWLTHNALLQFNLVVILSCAVGAFGVYLLVRSITSSTGAAIVAGAAFALLPYNSSQIGHPHVSVHLIPYLLLILRRLERRPVPSTWLMLGFVFALIWWSSLTEGLLAVVVVLTWAAWRLGRDGSLAWREVSRAALGIVGAVVLLVPLAIPYLGVRSDHPEFRHPTDEARYYSATFGSYLVPLVRSGPVTGPVYRSMREQFEDPVGSWEKVLWPGIWLAVATLVAAVAAVATFFRRRPNRAPPWVEEVAFFLLLAAIAMVLSLGPNFDGKPDGLPLPFWVVQHVVPGGLLRVPARFGLLAELAAVLAAGIALGSMRAEWRRRLVAVSLVVIVIEALPSRLVTVVAPRPTPANRSLAGGQGAVLALPTAEIGPTGLPTNESVYLEPTQMYLSTVNFRPLVNGYASFVPDNYLKLIGQVQDLPSASAFAALHQANVTTVVVQTELVKNSRWRDVASRLDRWPGVRLTASSPGVRVYDIAQAAPAPR